jgi:hypothetical protein
MDIRKSYYDPEMVKNLSVMLRLSPEEVINKLWNNRVPTTMTKAQTTEEMLAKNPKTVIDELHEADDRDHADLERRAASRIDPQLLRVHETDKIKHYESRNPLGSHPPDEPTLKDDRDIYDMMTQRGSDPEKRGGKVGPING